jgi:hypothetical protein
MDIQNSAFTIKLKLCFCTILGIRIDDCCVLYTLLCCLFKTSSQRYFFLWNYQFWFVILMKEEHYNVIGDVRDFSWWSWRSTHSISYK